VRELRPFFAAIPKARTAKLVRSVIDALDAVPGARELAVALCEETVAWCRAEKRSFLRLRVQIRLATLLLGAGRLAPALALLGGVLREVKKLDDKALLVEVHLLESKVQLGLRNVPKARAALTAARTAGSAIYVGPELQAELDLQAGTLHAEERDFRTAYSYFYEAFEGLNALGEPAAAGALKRMLLCKVMTDGADDVAALLGGKHGLKHAGRPLEAMRAVAGAYKERSLLAFERALKDFGPELVGDAFVASHARALYDAMLEANLLRLVEPYAVVEIGHVAALIGLPPDAVERKLSQMVLDKKFSGTLDAGAGQLLVHDAVPADRAYEAAVKAFANLGDVVDVLQARANKLI